MAFRAFVAVLLAFAILALEGVVAGLLGSFQLITTLSTEPLVEGLGWFLWSSVVLLNLGAVPFLAACALATYVQRRSSTTVGGLRLTFFAIGYLGTGVLVAVGLYSVWDLQPDYLVYLLAYLPCWAVMARLVPPSARTIAPPAKPSLA